MFGGDAVPGAVNKSLLKNPISEKFGYQELWAQFRHHEDVFSDCRGHLNGAANYEWIEA
jgi:hypothetical protein